MKKQPLVEDIVERIDQSVPTIEIHQFKPIIRLLVEMPDEPSTTLGRICIILHNGLEQKPRKKTQWSVESIRWELKDHGWKDSDEAIGNAIVQLLNWEILKRNRGKLLLKQNRIKVTEHTAELIAQ